MTTTMDKNDNNETEYLSQWFIEGLKEIGITKEEYLRLSQKDKNEIIKYLEGFGH
jgi:hypothetical protein